MTLLGLSVAFDVTAGITFTEWYDDEGVRHVSNVPKECITEAKTIRQECRSSLPQGSSAQVQEKESQEDGPGLTLEQQARRDSIESYLRDTDPLNPDSIQWREARARAAKREKEFEQDLLRRDPAKYQNYRKFKKEFQERLNKDAAIYAKRQALRKELDELNRLEKAP